MSTNRTAPTIIGTAIVAGAILRLVPCFNDFWLDEIWSYYYARDLTSPVQVFTGVHHSNNHHLPMLWLYAFGDTNNWVWYRIPSLIAGIGSVVLAAYLSWRRGRIETVFVTILFGFSFLLVEYSSEARGYSCALFFALLSYAALDRYLNRGGWKSGTLFIAGAILGVLSQLVFLLFYVSAVVWGVVRLRKDLSSPGATGSTGRRQRGDLSRFLVLQSIPVTAFLALYLVDLRHMEVGSGEPLGWQVVFGQTIGHLFGLPVQLGVIYPILVALLLVIGVRFLAKRDDDSWILLLGGMISPGLAILVARPDVVAPRYFIIAAALLLWMTGMLLAALYRGGRIGRIASLAALLLFLGGNASYVAGFLERGRGGYSDAVRYMAAHTHGANIVAGLDHEFRTGIVLRFYARWLPAGRELLVATTETWPVEGPEWVVTHRPDNPKQPAPQIADRHGNGYLLEAEYPFAGLSGFYWALYHNVRNLPDAARD